MTNPTNKEELVARLEAAEAGRPVLSEEVLRTLGFKLALDWTGGWWEREGQRLHAAHTSVTTSLDAALALAERVLPGWLWSAVLLEPGHMLARRGRYYATVEPLNEWAEIHDASAPTPALALCIAILKASATPESPHNPGQGDGG